MRLSIWHVKIVYCVYLSVLEIIPSPQQMVMWRVRIHWQVQQTPVNAPYYSVDNSRFWCRVSSVVHKRFIPSQFAGLTYTG